MLTVREGKICKKILIPALLALCAAICFAGCGGNTKDFFDDSVRYAATPVVSEGKNYRVDHSYVDEYTNVAYWFIYLGKVEQVPISAEGTKYYNGVTPISLTYTTEKITEGHIEEKNEYAVQNSTKFTVSDQHKASGSFKVDATMGGVNAGYELGYSYMHDHGKEEENSVSLTNSYAALTGWQESNSEAVSYTIGEHGEKPGFYRYALFVSCDVYIAVAHDLINDTWHYKYSSFTRPDSFFTGIDYSENNMFKSRDDAVKLEFDTSVLDTLTIP